ncbi:MAG: protein kinase, partial [Bacteroidetes bacterium]|nr:protein kinase [Bacteroidota bacterium]
MIGQTISHYKILEKLGEGGMGVVYKAEDTKLDREVALKFLPHHISSSDVDRARFLQEAKAAAVLNHPNICTIHDIAEDAGEQFIVMEYVDGVTMKDKFSPAPLKLNDAVNYAIQIGEALQEAHSKGIVHRDVKSENIMVNSKNQVKVMDFGLAKLRGSVKLTKSSSTTGTLAYMAPEQIQGSDTDARADIFSFGVVLYEMLTGHTPFRGEHEAAMMYSIINEEPQPIQKFRDDLSSEMLHILNRALEKDPEERYQTVKDMTIDLRRLKKESTRIVRTTSTFVVADEEKEVRQVSGGSKKSNKTLWMGIGVTGLLAAILVLWFFGRSPELNPQMILRVLQIPFTQIGYPGMSPDGKWIAFPAASADNRWDIYFMNTLGGEPRRITSDSAIYMQSTDISPDGSLIAYDKATSPTDIAIYAVPSLGGISTKIADGGGLPRWRPDGKRIGFITLKLSDFWSVNTDGNDKKLEFTDSISFNAAGQLTRVSFSWSPDGNSVAWLTTFSSYQEIFIWDLISHRSRQLTFDKKNIDEVCWMPNNQIVFSSNRG